MSDRGPRRRIARGIYQDRFGYAAVVKGREKRYPPGTAVETMQRWRREMANVLTPPQRTAGGGRGTLERDVDLYIARSHHLASWREIRAHLRAWTALYGPWLRSRIRGPHVLQARTQWLAAGVAVKTVANREHCLRAMWRALDGRRCLTPLDDIDPLKPPKVPVQTVTVETILAVYRGLLAGEAKGTLRDAKTRARFMVMASCGIRPSELMRAKPEDVDLERRVWGTRDGKGGYRPGGLYLYDDLLVAMKVFVAAEAWGTFETSAFARTLRTAGWPAGVRPYRLRASVGVALSERGTDLADVGGWLGHTRPETTRTHYVPVLGGRMQQAGESLAGRLIWPEDLGSDSWQRAKPH